MEKRQFLKYGLSVAGLSVLNPAWPMPSNSSKAIFTSNPLLKTHAPEGWMGTPQSEKDRFRNINHPFIPSFSSVLKWKSSGNPQESEKKLDTWKADFVADGDFLHRKDDCLVWLGHASFFIRMEGVNILIDPVFGKATVVKRKQSSPYPAEVWTGIDILLISHDHRDHCDLPSLQKLARINPNIKVLTGLGMKKLLSRIFPANSIEEAGWYQKFTKSSFPEIWFMPSRHWSRRGLTDTNQRLWGGFYISGSKRIYFMGDSGYDTHFANIPRLHETPDLALMGIGAYSPEWFMHPSHMSPEDSWKSFLELKAGRMIPMHYATFDLSDEPAGEPLKRLQSVANSTDLLIPAIGKTNWI